MLIPRSANEIHKKWLSKVLQEREAKLRENDSCKVEVVEFLLGEGAKLGDSYNSDLAIADIRCIYSTSDGEQKEVQHSLYFKFHSLSAFSREFNILENNHLRELNLYSEAHGLLNKFAAVHYEVPPRLCLAELYHGYSDGDDYVLVLENMKKKGFVLNDKKRGLDFNQLKVVVKELATWHGLSYAFNQSEEGNKFRLDKVFPAQFKIVAMAKAMAGAGLVVCGSLIKDKEDFKEMVEQMANPEPIIEEYGNIMQYKGHEDGIRTLIHGDMWNNNILLKYAAEGDSTPEEVCFVDWQRPCWGRPVIDLQYLIGSSTWLSVRKAHLDELLHIYYDKLYSLVGSTLDYTYGHFLEDFNNTRIFGFIAAISFTCISMSNSITESVERPKSTTSVRGPLAAIKRAIASKFAQLFMHPSFEFIRKAAMKKFFLSISKEIESGSNEPLNRRLFEIFQEAKDKNIFGHLYAKPDTLN